MQREPGGLESAVAAEVHAGDLRLAQACARCEPAALLQFERELLPGALRAAAGILPAADARDELAQILRERLFQARPERPARIGDYNGQIPLAAWLRVIARRAALNLLESRGQGRESIDDHAELFASHATPEQALGAERFRGQFRAAFAAAVAGLASRDRAVLRLHLAEGVTLDGLASAYGVHRATVARWLATARVKVLERTRLGLARGLGASAAEIESLLRAARSQLDVSISAVFRSAAKEEPG